MKKNLIKFLILIFFLGAFFWMAFVISTTLFPKGNPIASVFTNLLNLPSDFVAKPKVVTQVKTFDDFMYGDFFYKFYAVSSAVLLIGLFTLTRSRNFIEKYLLVQAYALPREQDYWGKVEDRKMHSPVPFSVIRLFSINDAGEEVFISQAVADLDGRYRLYMNSLTSVNKLYIEVKSPNYLTLRQEIDVTSIQADKSIRTNIYLDKENDIKKINPIRQFFVNHREETLYLLTGYILILSLTTFFHAIYSIVLHPNFISVGDLIFYGFAAPWNLFVLSERRKFNPGRFINTYNKREISNVKIQIFINETKSLSLFSDERGVVRFDVEPGKYKIKAYKPGFDLESASDIMVQVTKEGYLKENVYMQPANISIANASLKYQNPFGNRVDPVK